VANSVMNNNSFSKTIMRVICRIKDVLKFQTCWLYLVNRSTSSFWSWCCAEWRQHDNRRRDGI